MQHCCDADPRAEVPGIGGGGEQRIRSRAEEQVVHHRLVLPPDGGDLGGHGEHME